MTSKQRPQTAATTTHAKPRIRSATTTPRLSLFMFIGSAIILNAIIAGDHKLYCMAAPSPLINTLSSLSTSEDAMVTASPLVSSNDGASTLSLGDDILAAAEEENGETPSHHPNMGFKRVAATDTSRIGNLTRNHLGDVFNVYETESCDTDTCVGLSSGTADIHKYEIKDHDFAPKSRSATNDCKCQCLPHLTTYREDLGICVDDIHECMLAPFVSGSSSERIPFVFLPLRGQIIHPSKEISFPGINVPICAVSSAQFLSNTGWNELRTQMDGDVPFRLFRDEGRTFLQWLGEPELRQRMQGRLILVHLLCRDMSPLLQQQENGETSEAKDVILNQNIYSPCVAFRVVGTPAKYVTNVTEVSFSSDTHSNPEASIAGFGLTTKEYVVIGACSLILGLIYVASVFLYLHMKKRKAESHSGSMRNPKSEINYPKSDEVTFGAAFSRNGSIVSTYTGQQSHPSLIGGRSIGHDSGRRSSLGGHRSHNSGGGGVGMNLNSIPSEEMMIVKNNPLLNHFPNVGDMSDLSLSASDGDEEKIRLVEKILGMHQTSAMIHPASGASANEMRDHLDAMNHLENMPMSSQENECIPEENVSITEDMSTEDKLENMRAIVNGTMRRKLYFNPAYFEPHLLQEPPAAAIEFLTKIREVITIAKYKMSSKRFQPSLNHIPEEYHGNEIYSQSSQAISNRRGSAPSLKRNNARHISCSGCPGCENSKATDQASCQNCGDKQNSIRKWLEGVSATDGVTKGHDLQNFNQLHAKCEKSETSSSSDNDTIKANSIKSKRSNKGKAPPIPSTTPKILATSFKSQSEIEKLVTQSEEREMGNSRHKPKAIDTQEIYSKNIELYNKISRSGGNLLFNNPQFDHSSSPAQSRRSSHKSRSSRKQIEVLDQYANPAVLKQRQYEMMRNIHDMPDMVYEALTMDYTKMKGNQYHLPTPDYQTDEESKTAKLEQEDPFMPTPDYNTLGRIPKRPNYQPDSPIYSRKSPHYLIVDYETDSLERSASHKTRNTNSPVVSGTSETSQVSPSLSFALPMEEELEIQNAVYDRVEGFRKDPAPISKNSTPSTIYEMMSYNPSRLPPLPPQQPKVKYNTPYEGSMTIEVDHSPSDVEVSTDSDQFEPDTLDRKPRKNLQNKTTPLAQFKPPPVEKAITTETIPVNDSNRKNDQLVLKSASTFKPVITQPQATVAPIIEEPKRSIGSLREIYEAKNIKNLQPPSVSSPPKTTIETLEKGRILTLDARHSKRQRKRNDGSLKKLVPPEGTLTKLAPPDVVPSSNQNIYTQDDLRSKSLIIQEQEDTEPYEMNSNSSEQNDDKNPNHMDYMSETFYKDYSHVDKLSKFNSLRKSPEAKEYITENSGCFINKMENNQPYGILENFMTLGDISNQNFIDEDSKIYNYSDENESARSKSPNEQRSSSSNNSNAKECEDPDKIEVLSSKSLSLNSKKLDNSLTTAKVFRVEINSSTHGMQIAMGLKDRAKKSKDIKNAWKRFMSIATSKFNRSGGDSEIYEKSSVLSDGIDPSIIDESNYKKLVSRLSPKSELESGYMSSDSSESRLQSRRYERYNFKAKSATGNNNIYDVIEDIKDESTDELSTKQVIGVSTPKTMTPNRSLEKQKPNTPSPVNTIAEMNNAPMSCILEIKDAVSVNLYSSDDERYSSGMSSDEDSAEGDGCESGAESVETHSVLFKNIRKLN